MPSASRPPSPGNDAPVPDETAVADLTVEGTLPTALSGQYVRIGPNRIATPRPTEGSRLAEGMVHAVALRAGRPVGYRNRWITTDVVARTLGTEPIPGPPAAAADTVASNVIAFAGRVLALGPGALAYELDQHLLTLRRVDLAGHGQGIGAHPQVDPVTGALHLIAHGDERAHQIVAPNSQTRISIPIRNAPGPVCDLLLTRDHFVLLGPGFVGVTDRTRPAPTRWSAANVPGAFAARDAGGAVVVLTASRSLVRWTIEGAGARRDVVDDTPQRFGRVNPATVDNPRYLWTVDAPGGTAVYRHDLRTGDRTAHDLGPGHHPGELVFVADPARSTCEDGGWLIGLVHDESRTEAELVVLDAAALDRPPLATVHIPRRIPYGLHGTWIPRT